MPRCGGEIKLGDTVVVQGSGAIGLVTLACAKLSGAAKAIMVGGPAGRLELAKRLGADVTIDIEEVTSVEERTELVKAETPRREGADVVFECAGFPPGNAGRIRVYPGVAAPLLRSGTSWTWVQSTSTLTSC